LGIENLNHIFNPKRIAVIGASERKGSIGAKILRNLIGVGYQGGVYPVNTFRQTVQGIPAYPSIRKISRKIDLAIIATPAHTVPQIVEECGDAGVSGLIINSAGFREVGNEGILYEQKIIEYQKKFNMRIIGPNSYGVLRPGINLYATFAGTLALPGNIAFLSQSAALCASALDWALDSGVGFSAVVSTGSMLDVDFGDLIDYFGTDPKTKSIVLYVESIKNARKFMSAARAFSRTKPIVVVKAGRSKESVASTLSHSGSLGGEDAVYDSAFRRAGVVRVAAIIDLFNCAEALAMQSNPAGPNLTIITNAGGPAIMATDHLADRGGKISQLSKSTIQNLKNILPPYCCTINPVDIFEEATPERFGAVLDICLKDKNSNGFLLIYAPQEAADPIDVAKTVVEMSNKTDKPILVSFMSEENRSRNACKLLQSNGIPVFTTPEQAVSTFMYMYSYTQNLELLYQTPEELSIESADSKSLKEILRRAICAGKQSLSLKNSLRFLEKYNIPTVKTEIALSSEEAKIISSKLGYPLVMKLLSPQLVHKSKNKGIILNICSPADVKVSYDQLYNNLDKFKPGAIFQGIALQPMIRKNGYELLVGCKKDSQFGSVILFGTGGTNTELFKDIVIGFPPLNQVLARRLMEHTSIYKYAAASEFPLNIHLLEKLLVKFSQLVIDFPEIKEIDINPLIVDQDSAVAVDARIVLDLEQKNLETGYCDHLVIAPYPNKYISEWKTKDGEKVLLRPIKPEDELLFNKLFTSLSPETKRFRFFDIIKELSHEKLTRFCNLDNDREIAVIAKLKKDETSIIGVARLILDTGGNNGEFAVLVSDKWQGKGIGSKLVDCIIEIARDMGVKSIYSDVIYNNQKMLSLAKKKGFRKQKVDYDTIKIVLTFD
jgi:acetyltransferase